MLTREEFHNLLQSGPILLDGATGSNLQKEGMPRGCCTEQWVLEHPDALLALQRRYALAGSKILYALVMLKNMFVPSAGSAAYPVAQFVDARLVVFVAVGILLSGFLQEKLPLLKQYIFSREVHTLEMLYLPLLYFICIVSLVSSTYNPFIYFRF